MGEGRGEGGEGGGEIAGERYNRVRALRAPRAHTVGYLGGCDQELGEIESVAHQPTAPHPRACCRVYGSDYMSTSLIGLQRYLAHEKQPPPQGPP